ncbi:ATP-binding protein [Massilia sp. YIM B04103]|uniref:ATP-binding protein n=1 Tax=Massilia sp. YIM B04103 TaxID=2963106 RepID=UPI00210DC9D4|nr:ATP-binding protein [Massilia sp. YIM B04103]
MNQSHPPVKRQTILIVSGSENGLVALELALAEHGLGLAYVNRGDAALLLAEEGHVALVLLDAALAGSASLELCERLARRNGLPVLIMSSAPSEDERERARQAGAAGYVRLPFATADAVNNILVELGARGLWSDGAPASLDPAHLEINYHTLLAGSPDSILLLNVADRKPIDANAQAETLFGRSVAELRHKELAQLCPPLQQDGRLSADVVDDLIERVLGGEIRVFPLSFQHANGRLIDCEIRLVPLEKDKHHLLHLRLLDVTGQRLAEALRAGQNKLLEMIARGAPLHATLDRLVKLVETQSPELLCSVLLLDEDGKRMRAGSAPSLPGAYMAAIDGMEIGPMVGSCGTAMYRREAVIVSDIMHDPLWEPYRGLAGAYGLRACWSMPIMLNEGTVLGSFAMYYREVRHPSTEDQRLISVATHLAGIAIERTRREAELQQHRRHLEELVADRTAALRRAKEQAEQANAELARALEHLSMTQEELVRRDKLAALGAIVAGVAHELNTPIGNSLMVATTMSERTNSLHAEVSAGLRRSALEQYLQQAGEANELLVRNLTRTARLVASFKQIAVDTASSQRRRFTLDKFVAELVLPLAATLKHPGLRVVQEVAPHLEMDSYPGPLGQALSSLFENSVLHGFGERPGGTITIAGHAVGQDEVELSLADDGAGIAPEHQDRVFDPFFTTKLGAGGSGLGLHVTHNIVTGVLGGRIELHSAPGAGTRFTLHLPLVAPR